MIVDRGWQQSFSGKMFTPRYLQPEQVSWEDIPHALAQRVRFCGQLRTMGYTVAQHCVVGSRMIARPYKLAFLLHEVSEVYLPDVPSPLKPFLTVATLDGGYNRSVSWCVLEERHASVILGALGLGHILPLLDSPEVKEMDLRMLMTEKRDLAGPEPKPWECDAKPLGNISLRGFVWSMEDAKKAFTQTFHELTRGGL